MSGVEDVEIFRMKEAQRASQLLRMLCGQDRELEESDTLFFYSIIPEPSPLRPPSSG